MDRAQRQKIANELRAAAVAFNKKLREAWNADLVVTFDVVTEPISNANNLSERRKLTMEITDTVGSV